jgi:hypothetical protein
MIWDIPFERDAMIVSKRIASDVSGAEAVQQLVERQVADADRDMNSSKGQLWIFLEIFHLRTHTAGATKPNSLHRSIAHS